ncbi:dihydrolipoyllysine-residue succinyltransferase component of 2-oxoglutarate dehydrogenase complex [Glycocaulis albus]|uniref:Dihydrolipoyllysine-residue succinyltransferase component of 2-oxoglutarate dehydrogenase complex n=1 Tax=Glycocaulis albus TaxID=1382801 RepID=A0ABQ1XC32_9PROT|nr:2-oxoglutarate dehydrogenase complex dihydrolipoyllysine-residue succinyltransferase [Glycocaulis albus]GGG89894.1 dihydrolipoyllysine-residue succinyltransferase component of 2-oxoglutarate dehydrogenase complex [Glycocaulis albus]
MSAITVPTLGESVSEATVGSWLVSEGQSVKKDDVLVELETDKVSVEVRAEEDGVITAIKAKEGETVEIGAALAEFEAGASGAKSPEPKKAEKKDEAPKKDDKPAEKSEAKSDEAKSDQAKSGAGGALTDAKVPVMGESVAEGTVGNWLVKVGDSVSVDQPLMEIETDKVAVEVPSPVAGVLEEALVKEGDSVEPGQVVAKIREGASGGSAKSESKSEAPKAESKSSDDVKAMPSAQRVASENKVDLSKVEGTGRDGRVTKGDALKAVEQGARAPEPAAVAQASAPRETGEREERVKMTRLRQTIARRLKEAQNSAAMLTTYNEADMSAIMALRKEVQDDFTAKHGIKLGFMSFFVKACVAALQDIPAVNAEIDGTDIIYKNYYDIGVAVGTDRGLVVPVVRDCDQKSLAGIEKGIMDLGKRARDGQLGLEDMQGATFTISNGGVYGSLMSSPILNAPQSGILGMHKIQERPVAINGQVVIRPMMYLALSYDHRIVDGKEAVTFLVRVKESLEKPERLLLDI